jgi:hypothetical protein
MQAANDDKAYTVNDTFGECDCGCGQFWLWFSPEWGAWRIICAQCDLDYTEWVA